MSYDLMVFDVQAAPSDAAAFLKWYEKQAEWAEDHSYDDSSVSAPALQAWFLEMIQEFPAMNGPHASDDDVDDPKVTDYCVGRSVIYAGFAWSQAEAAYRAMTSLAQKHRLGFFDASGDGAIWVPEGDDYRQMPNADDA